MDRLTCVSQHLAGTCRVTGEIRRFSGCVNNFGCLLVIKAMEKKIYLTITTLLLFVSTSFIACHKKGDPSPDPQPESSVDVYVAGNNGSGAFLWKNGTAATLPSGNDANDIEISGNDVFVSGFGMNKNDRYVAKYWKNGVSVDLTDGTRNSYCYDIYLNGNDVYAAGRQQVSNGSTYVATYWKNGTQVTLGDPSENSLAAALLITGSDIYVIGKHNKAGNSPVACYWKNGTLVDLSNESTYAGNQAITVSGSDIYMLWSATYNNEGLSRTSYSKNFGAPVVIKDAAQNFDGNSIVVSGSDVYVSGLGISTTGNVFSPTYYKNESPVLINDGPKSAFATNITINNSDVYVAGWTENVAAGNSPAACFWKNGKITLLGSGTSQSLARKIVVVKKS